MKVFLVLWLVVGGQDIGGPPVEMPSMQECEARAEKMRVIGVPEGAEIVRIGCVTEMHPDRPT